MGSELKPAVAYLRTSSAANVGADKDSDKRQRAAIKAFAKRAGFTIVAEHYDAAVSGADHVDQAPWLCADAPTTGDKRGQDHHRGVAR